MTSWHRNRRGRSCTTPRCRSQNIANNMQITRFRKVGCKNPRNLQVCGPRQQPTMQKTLQIQRFHAECCKTQVLGPYHVGGGGGGSEPRTGNIYLYIPQKMTSTHVFGNPTCLGLAGCGRMSRVEAYWIFDRWQHGRVVPGNPRGTSPANVWSHFGLRFVRFELDL